MSQMIKANFNECFDPIEETHVFIQYKGTDICLDFRCECGAVGHFDGDFAYALRCAECGETWGMPHDIQLVKGFSNGSVKDIPKEYDEGPLANTSGALCWVCHESSGFQRDFKTEVRDGVRTIVHDACLGKERQ